MAHAVLTDQAVGAAFDYLNEKSEEIGIARANVLRAQYLIETKERQAKEVHAKLFLQASGTEGTRKAWATSHEEYATACDRIDEARERYAKAIEVWENMSDSRNRANLIIDAWRTAEASGRQVRSIR